MRYAFFSITAMFPEAGEKSLNEFVSAHKIIHIEKSFVADGQGSYWAFCVNYLESNNPSAPTTKNKIDYREILDADDFALYAILRTLRKSVAEQLAIPAYAVFTNEQLAEMARQRVTSKAMLSSISGVGKSRIEKYGVQFIAAVSAHEKHQVGEAK